MKDEVPGDAFFCSRVRARLMFGENAMSSSESLVSSTLGVPVPGVLETGLRRVLGVWAGSSSRCWSGCRSPKNVIGSLIEGALDGEV